MIKLLNKAAYIRPDTDFSGNIDYLEANLFCLVQFNATFEIQTAARASDGFNISVSDEDKDTDDYLTQGGSFADFQQGELVDVTDLEDVGGNLLLPAGTYTIDYKDDDNSIRLADSVGNPLTLVTGVPVYGEIRRGEAVTGAVRLDQEPYAAQFDYGLIGNDEAINYQSKVDGQQLTHILDSGAALPGTLTTMVDKYKASAKTGTVQIRKTFSDNVNKIWRYEIEQTFRINPYYLLGQLGQYQNGQEVSLFAEQLSLRHIFRLRLFQTNTGSPVFQESEVDFSQVSGNVGARNENYNNQEPQYLLQSLDYNNTIGQLTKDGTNSLTIEISEVSNVAGWVELYFILLPEQDEDFKNNSTLMDDNFAFDSVVIQVGGGAVNGTRVLQNCSATTAAGVVTVDAEILFDAATKAKIDSYADKNYIIKANVYSAGQAAGNTDETIIDVDFNNIGFEIPLGTIDTETSLLPHDFNAVEDGNTSPAEIFANDEVVMNTLIFLDSDTFSDITLEKVVPQLIATDGANEAVLQSLEIDTSDAQVVGGARLVDESIATGLNVRNDELKSRYRLYREPSLDTGTKYAYRLLYPFIYRWEYWEQLVLDNLVNDFYDPSEQFNGFNHNWNRLADVAGYSIKYRVRVEAKVQGGNLTAIEDDFDLESYDYNEGITTSATTELFDDLAPLIYDGQPYIKDGVFTKIVTTWTFPSAVDAADYWGYFHIGKKENHTFRTINTLSSEYNREDISYLDSNGGAGFVVLANSAADEITATAYVNPNEFRGDANEYTVFSRINARGVIIPFEGTFETTNTEAGSSAANELFLPINGTIDIKDNGDGNQDLANPYTYGVGGQYTVKVFSGSDWYLQYRGTPSNDRLKIIGINRWGNSFKPVGSIDSVFRECDNLTITATDTPDTSALTSLQNWFLRNFALTEVPTINEWDFGLVTSAVSIFAFNNNLNQELNLTLPSCTSLLEALRECTNQNKPITITLGASPANFQGFLQGATLMNSPVTINGQISNAASMFQGCSNYDQPTTLTLASGGASCSSTFRDNKALNSPITISGQITNASNMLRANDVFNQSINSLDFSITTTMSAFMDSCLAYNQPVNINAPFCNNFVQFLRGGAAFDSTVIIVLGVDANFSNAFGGCGIFNSAISITGASISAANQMHQNSTLFNQPLNYDTSNCISFVSFLQAAINFNQDISNLSFQSVPSSSVNMAQAFDNTALDKTNAGELIKKIATDFGWDGLPSSTAPATTFNVDIGGANVEIQQGSLAEDAYNWLTDPLYGACTIIGFNPTP